MDKIIETIDLSKSYGNRQVVNKLNLEVYSGEIFGFLGPNGAGKTTTIRMLIGLVQPTGGEARIFNYKVGREQAKISPRISAITETPAFIEHLSAFDNLQVFAGYAGMRLKKVEIEKLLENSGLAKNARGLVRTFSLGMKQRLGLAFALINNPRLIFLDEPSNGLDPAGIIEIRRSLKYLAAEEGRTIFISSHQLSEVEQTCDRVAIIERGETKLTGTVAELLTSNEWVVIEAAPVAAAVKLINDFYPNLICETVEPSPGKEGDLPKLKFRLENARQMIPAIVRTLATEGIEVFEVTTERRNLNDLFMEVTTR